MFGLWAKLLNAFHMGVNFFDSEFGVLLGEYHGLYQVKQHFGDVFFGQ